MSLEPWYGEGLFEYDTKSEVHKKKRLINQNA